MNWLPTWSPLSRQDLAGYTVCKGHRSKAESDKCLSSDESAYTAGAWCNRRSDESDSAGCDKNDFPGLERV